MHRNLGSEVAPVLVSGDLGLGRQGRGAVGLRLALTLTLGHGGLRLIGRRRGDRPAHHEASSGSDIAERGEKEPRKGARELVPVLCGTLCRPNVYVNYVDYSLEHGEGGDAVGVGLSLHEPRVQVGGSSLHATLRLILHGGAGKKCQASKMCTVAGTLGISSYCWTLWSDHFSIQPHPLRAPDWT